VCTQKPKKTNTQTSPVQHWKKPKAITKLWFSHLLRHLARKQSGSILGHKTHTHMLTYLLDCLRDLECLWHNHGAKHLPRQNLRKERQTNWQRGRYLIQKGSDEVGWPEHVVLEVACRLIAMGKHTLCNVTTYIQQFTDATVKRCSSINVQSKSNDWHSDKCLMAFPAYQIT